MNKDTYGSAEQFKMIVVLTKEISKLNKLDKRKISKFLEKFNKIFISVSSINDTDSKRYALDLMYTDYMYRVDKFISNRYDKEITTRVRNFIYAKIKNAKYE